MFQDEHTGGLDVQRGIVNTLHHFLVAFEHHRRAGVLEKVGRGCRGLDHCALRCKVSLQHRERPFRTERLSERPNHIGVETPRLAEGFGQGFARHRQSVAVQKRQHLL